MVEHSFTGVPTFSRATASYGWVLSRPSVSFRETKRGFDFGLASVLIIVTLPVLLLAIFAIALTSGGPIFFRQKRVGFQRREFTIFKLRTMRTGEAPKAPGNRIFNKVEGDERVTRVGRFLRKFSVDELPQLFNVLLGDMSIVGPRPLLPSDMERFPIGRPRRRFDVKPGLTGLWQVSGRSLLSDEERIRLDLEYVERWTPWLDAWILFRTPLAVILAKGAF